MIPELKLESSTTPPAKRILFPDPAAAGLSLASLNWSVVQTLNEASYISSVLEAPPSTILPLPPGGQMIVFPPPKRILLPAAAAVRFSLASLNRAVVQMLDEASYMSTVLEIPLLANPPAKK